MRSGGVVAQLARPPGNLNATLSPSDNDDSNIRLGISTNGFYIENGEIVELYLVIPLEMFGRFEDLCSHQSSSSNCCEYTTVISHYEYLETAK